MALLYLIESAKYQNEIKYHVLLTFSYIACLFLFCHPVDVIGVINPQRTNKNCFCHHQCPSDGQTGGREDWWVGGAMGVRNTFVS